MYKELLIRDVEVPISIESLLFASRVHVSRSLLIRWIVSALCPLILTLHCTYWAHGPPWDRSSVGEKRKTERTSVTINARVETERPFASWRHSSRRSGREKNEREGEARSNPTETNDFAAHARKRGRKGRKRDGRVGWRRMI